MILGRLLSSHLCFDVSLLGRHYVHYLLCAVAIEVDACIHTLVGTGLVELLRVLLLILDLVGLGRRLLIAHTFFDVHPRDIDLVHGKRDLRVLF